MQKIRTIVSLHYRFSKYNNVRQHIMELLKDDNFTCQDWKKVMKKDIWKPELTQRKPSEKRFLAEIIVLAIAAVFFQNDKKSLGRRDGTDRMFHPLRAETVVLVAAGIQHALNEYSAIGSKKIARFDGNTMRSM